MKDGFELRGTEGKGEGIFATRSFKTGETVMVGRIEKVLDGNYSHASQIGENKYVLHAGSISKVNHSCDPNMWMADAYTLITSRDIKSGEELTADYALWEADESYVSKWKCKCGSPLCRGRVTGVDWKKPDLQNRYKEHFSPLLNKRIQRLKDSV